MKALQARESFAAKANKRSLNESFPCAPACLWHSHVVLPEKAYHNTNHRGLGLLGKQEVLGISLSDTGMRPAPPVPIVVQDEGYLELLGRATGRVSPAGSAALPVAALSPCSATAQHAHLPPSYFSADSMRGQQWSRIPWGRATSVTSLCSSQPPSPVISPSLSGHWF